MGDNTKIEWATHPATGKGATWNPITGCSLVSEGCRNCYAAQLAGTRLKNHPSRKGLARQNAAGEWKFTGAVRFNEQWIDQPLRWKAPRGIFVCAHGATTHELMARFGWSSPSMAEPYTRSADRQRISLAASARAGERMEAILPRTLEQGAGKTAKKP